MKRHRQLKYLGFEIRMEKEEGAESKATMNFELRSKEYLSDGRILTKGIEGQEEDIAAWTGDQKAETKAQGLDRNTNSLICATCKREPLNSVMVTEIFLDFANFGVQFWDPCSFECYQPSG